MSDSIKNSGKNPTKQASLLEIKDALIHKTIHLNALLQLILSCETEKAEIPPGTMLENISLALDLSEDVKRLSSDLIGGC